MKTQKLSPTPALYRPAIPILATGFGHCPGIVAGSLGLRRHHHPVICSNTMFLVTRSLTWPVSTEIRRFRLSRGRVSGALHSCRCWASQIAPSLIVAYRWVFLALGVLSGCAALVAWSIPNLDLAAPRAGVFPASSLDNPQKLIPVNTRVASSTEERKPR